MLRSKIISYKYNNNNNNNKAQSFIGLGLVVVFKYRLHLAFGEECVKQCKYVILFAFGELFNILKPFHCPTVKGQVTGHPSDINQCDIKSLGNLLGCIEGYLKLSNNSRFSNKFDHLKNTLL